MRGDDRVGTGGGVRGEAGEERVRGVGTGGGVRGEAGGERVRGSRRGERERDCWW